MNPFLFSIRSRTGGNVPIIETIPESLSEFLLPGARPFLALATSGYLLVQEIKSPDFSLWHYTILLAENDSFHITCNAPMLSLNFCLQNSFVLCKTESDEHLDFQEGQYNMSFLLKLNIIANFPKDRVHTFLTLFYSLTYLSKLSVGYPLLTEFLNKTANGQESFLYTTNQYADKEMRKSIFNMLQSNYKEEDTGLCIKKGRALEILIAALEFSNHQTGSFATGITREETEKICAAKQWLEQEMNRPVTLFELAKRVGMNVHNLSCGFHQITGTTVFHYHRKVRMQKAIQLLEETDRDLFDIGTEIGYIDGKTFSKEFKKENGVGPFEYRKQFRLQVK